MIIGVIIGIVVLFLLVMAGLSVKIIREYQRIVLFRLGRAIGIRGPGLVLINPITDRTAWVDLRERFLEIPQQTAITKDNASISIDFIIFYKVVDPAMSVLQVQNFAGAGQNVAATSLRSVVGDMALDDILSKREEMNASLRVRLDEVTERWGVKVTAVEVREVNPPSGVLEAMTRQMSAERTRRAAITEAQGQKQAQITLAEGKKQAAILGAEGERQAAILRAEGLAAGLQRIYAVGRGLDPNTMRLQYLETLKQVGTSDSTKIVIPMELGGLVSGLRNLLPADAAGTADLPAEGLPAGWPAAGTLGAAGEGGSLPEAALGNGRSPEAAEVEIEGERGRSDETGGLGEPASPGEAGADDTTASEAGLTQVDLDDGVPEVGLGDEVGIGDEEPEDVSLTPAEVPPEGLDEGG